MAAYVALFGSSLLPNSATYTQQPEPTNIRRHITTDLITHRRTIIDFLTSVTLANTDDEHPEGGVTVPKYVGAILM